MRGAFRLLIALWLSFAYAGKSDDTTGSRTWVEEKYGVAAAERVLAWRRLMSENRNKDEPTKLLLVNDFFNRLKFSTDLKLWGKEDYWATPVEAMGIGGASRGQGAVRGRGLGGR